VGIKLIWPIIGGGGVILGRVIQFLVLRITLIFFLSLFVQRIQCILA